MHAAVIIVLLMVYRITETQAILNDDSDLTEYYNGDERLPVFMRHSPTYRFTVERLCNILLDPDINLELVCKSRPTRIGHNVTFVVDCSYFPDRKDVLVDDIGVLVLNGSRKTQFSASISHSAVSISTDDSGDYVMHRAWHIHGTSKDLRRLVVSIQGIS